jgi:hypothetical protein
MFKPLLLFCKCNGFWDKKELLHRGLLYPLGRLGTVPRGYEPFKAYNISLEKIKK